MTKSNSEYRKEISDLELQAASGGMSRLSFSDLFSSSIVSSSTTTDFDRSNWQAYVEASGTSDMDFSSLIDRASTGIKTY